MKTKKVCCQSCGADLEVDESIRFVTCNFCGSKLEIVHGTTTTHSRLLEEIGEKTDRMSEDLKVIRLQNELERVDREWQVQREGLMTKDKDGGRSKPTAGGSVIGAAIAAVFGIIWIGMASSVSSAGGPAGIQLFGVVFIVAAIFMAIGGVNRAGRYQQAEAEMQRKRRKLKAEIDALK